jgi:type IV secretory pathway VirB6-like protein
MKFLSSTKNIKQIIIALFALFISFPDNANSSTLPPPLDRPLTMMNILIKHITNSMQDEEVESEDLYDGIRFSRRQQCTVADINNKRRIDECDGFMGTYPCDERQAQSNVSNGTIGKIDYGERSSLLGCTSPGFVEDRHDLYQFYKDFREVKDNAQAFKEKTANFARGDTGSIEFAKVRNGGGEFTGNYGAGTEYAQTIYSSSYDKNYKKCNVGNLGHATHSNDMRIEDYANDGGGFFIPALASEDFADDLSNETCSNFFIPHMEVWGATMILGMTSSIFGSVACSAVASVNADAVAVADNTKKVGFASRVINKIKSATSKIAKKHPKKVKTGVFLAKASLTTILDGLLFCYDAVSNTRVAASAPACITTPPGTCTISGPLCIASVGTSYASCLTFIASTITYYSQIAEKFATANTSFQTNQMCGAEWITWQWNKPQQQWNVDNKTSYQGCLKSLFTNREEFKNNQEECKKYGNFTNGFLIPNSPNEVLFSKFHFDYANQTALKEASKPDITNQYYREYWFGGIEYQDNEGQCKNPWQNDLPRRIRYLGYSSERQRYYVRGPISEVAKNSLSVNYACDRFLRGVPGSEVDENNAYQCCKRKAQTSICIEQKLVYVSAKTYKQKHKYKFCSLGDDNCKIGDSNDTAYKIFSSKKNPEYICARTNNHCPYDHYLSGGTEKKFESIDHQDTSTPKVKTVVANFCQHLAHCAKSSNGVTRINLPSNSYLSLACRNFVGDSLFRSSAISGGRNLQDISQSDIIVQKKSRNLTAPMVQCLKETLENYLLAKRALICNDDQDYELEEYRKYGVCKSGAINSPGASPDGKSVFLKLRENFQNTIKVALTLSVALFGLLMLFAGNQVNEMLNKKTLAVFVFKIAIVSFFALGNAWENYFMKVAFEAPLEFAELVFQPVVRQSENKVYDATKSATPRLSKSSDGCIFPPIDENGVVTKTYPVGKEYLRIFDTFDCKISHLLGYSADTNVPNFLKMIVVGFFSGGLGFAFMLASVVFAFFMILIALRVVHLIIVTIIVLSILVYISPLAFCCLMFNRTKHIFQQWLSQIMGYIIQPVIIFAYLGLFLTVIDNAMIGNAEFVGLNESFDGNFQKMNCDERDNIFDNDNVLATKNKIKPKETSAICAMAEAGLIENNVEGVKKISLQPFNLVITVFQDVKDDGAKRLKSMFKLALITFIFYKIFEYITSLASSLTGAADSTQMLDALKQNMQGIGKKIGNVMGGAEKIGRDMAVRGGKDAVSKGYKKGRENFKSGNKDQASDNQNSSGGKDNQGGAA